jgi:hypothetical protein
MLNRLIFGNMEYERVFLLIWLSLDVNEFVIQKNSLTL